MTEPGVGYYFQKASWCEAVPLEPAVIQIERRFMNSKPDVPPYVSVSQHGGWHDGYT